MKLSYKIALLALFAMVLFGFTQQAVAQIGDSGDSLIVEWETEPGSFEPVVNALRDAIIADSLRPDGRVYVLRRGGFYWNTNTVSNADFHLNIVGQGPEALAEGEEDFGQAVLQRVAFEDGTAPDGVLLEASTNLTVKNVWIMGETDQGALATYEPIQLLGDGARFTFDRVVFDRNDWHHLGSNGVNGDFFITNCEFRNNFGPTQVWEGRGIRFNSGADSAVIENTTFFNIGSIPIQAESATPVNYLRVNHNTFVNIGRWIGGSVWKEVLLTNNVFVNYGWHGRYIPDLNPADADPFGSFFSIGPLGAQFGTDDGRDILIANNAYWRDSAFDDWYPSADIQPLPFLNDTTMNYIAAWPTSMKIQGNYANTNPDLATYPLDTEGLLDSMKAHITHLYAGGGTAPRYFWDLGRTDVYDVITEEDFSYTNATLLTGATDGLPVGDLNWFPDAKADFDANMAAYVTAIEDIIQPPVTEVMVEEQAEDGTVADGAEALVADGLTYFQMNNGFIKWDFELPAEGQYDINVFVDLNNRATSGVNFFVNGYEIHDTRGWGQYVFGIDEGVSVHPDFPPSGFDWWLVTQDELAAAEIPDAPLVMPAGANTIEIRASWCDNGFGGLQILEAGTDNVVVELSGADVTDYFAAVPSILNAVWAPVNFKYVAMNGGSVSWPVDLPGGTYRARVFYQNYESDAISTISIGGNEVATADLTANTDSTGQDVLSSEFMVEGGASTLSLAASGANVDYIQLIQYTFTGVNDEPRLPDGYSLSQNYPNPFNPTTNINFSIAKTANVKLTIYNVLGQKIATLVDARLNAGAHTVNFDASNFASGVYFYQIKAGDFTQHKQMLLIK